MRMRNHPARIDPKRWRAVRRAILEAASYRCATCGRYGNQVDHVQPIHRGGPHWPGEGGLQCICAACHRIKSDSENPAVVPKRREWQDYLTRI